MITVKYKTVEDYCPCCNQPLKEPKVSEVEEFDFSDEDLESTELKYFIKNNELSEARGYLADMLFETISFFALSNPEATVEFIDGEIDKTLQYVLDKFKNN